MSGHRKGALWAQFVLASLVVVGVFLQAFFISAYTRGAGEGALDAHGAFGGITHLLEALVFLVALVAWWRAWGQIALAFALPVLGTAQIAFVGDTDERGGWVNGLHGFGALVVLVLAAIIAHRAMRALGLRSSEPAAGA